MMTLIPIIENKTHKHKLFYIIITGMVMINLYLPVFATLRTMLPGKAGSGKAHLPALTPELDSLRSLSYRSSMYCGAVAFGLGLGRSRNPNILRILLSICELSGAGPASLPSAARASWTITARQRTTRELVVAAIIIL